MEEPGRFWSRRAFVAGASACAAHAGLLSVLPFRPLGGASFASDRLPIHPASPRTPVATAPWGTIERLADGVWSLVSTPLEDRTTLCNGGIVSGRAGVLVIEAYGSDEGARWMAEQARELTGRDPTHVVLSHYHGDHTAGLAALAATGAEILVTDTTRDLVLERNQGAAREALEAARSVDTRRPTEIDLGGRSVLLVPRRGHTPSDLSVELPGDGVVFAGDLVWNGMFPNYVDAMPSRLGAEVRLLRERDASVVVPGHGGLADRGDLDRYIQVLDRVEQAARAAVERGMSAKEAAASFSIPDALGPWILFSPGYFERALDRWIGELTG